MRFSFQNETSLSIDDFQGQKYAIDPDSVCALKKQVLFSIDSKIKCHVYEALFEEALIMTYLIGMHPF